MKKRKPERTWMVMRNNMMTKTLMEGIALLL